MAEFDYPDAWRPNPGEVLEGEVTELSRRTGEYEPYPIVTVRCDDGSQLAFHAFHTAAKAKLADLNVQPGDQVGVLYKGKATTKDGKRSYEDYRIIVRGRPQTPFSWADDTDVTSDLPSDLPSGDKPDGDDPIPF